MVSSKKYLELLIVLFLLFNTQATYAAAGAIAGAVAGVTGADEIKVPMADQPTGQTSPPKETAIPTTNATAREQLPTPKTTPEPLPQARRAVAGNTIGNVINSGLVAKSGKWIY